MAIDFTPRYRDYARFCPAISEMYGRFVDNKNPKRPMPPGLTQHDLDFLDPTCGLYHIPYSLYSAGQAAKSSGAATKKDMVTGRNRAHSTLLGDSGGFQIQTGAIKFQGDKTRDRMMHWMEENCDWSMILDFPTGGINIGTIDPHTKRLNAELAAEPYRIVNDEVDITVSSVQEFCDLIDYVTIIEGTGERLPPDEAQVRYATCLLQTIINNDYFVKNRNPGKTKFLNVVQGRNPSESDFWYKHIKHYPFEGWSLAGHHKENFNMMIRRLISMRDDKLLENRDWMHILGVGKLANGCAYTTMQRCIRESINPNFTISYDVSSPFTTTAFGNLFLGYTLDRSSWDIQSGWVDGPEYLAGGPKAKIPFLEELQREWNKKKLTMVEDGGNSRFIRTEIGQRLLMEDICVNSDPKLTSTWDVVSYAMLMNHNLQVHLTGVFESQDLYDKGDVNHVPPAYLELREVIPEIFKSETPYDMIRKYQGVLNCLAGEGATAGTLQTSMFSLTGIKEHKEAVEKSRNHNKPKQPDFKVVDDFLS